ncbi:glycosyltransferase family 2 protein [Streptomyces sulphureus]|uniref:glycosyltransferase family 2 protein n=1 Tax=Streptomyces sulphureus TaxID=47758 RepID=UPI00037BC6F1|nr:glycosyltransferase [Streptomyces sulphureus]
MTGPRISVVLPAHCSAARHGTSRLRLALLSWSRQTLPRDAYEIVLVDNASDPPLAAQVSEWGLADRVRVVRREETGLGSGYNRGVEAAEAPLVLLATDDELAEPGLLATHVSEHGGEQPALVIGRCTILFHTELFPDVTKAKVDPHALERAAVREETRWLPGAAAALGLAEKPVTEEDVTGDFDKVLALAGTTPQFQDIERTVASGHCHTLPGGWLAVRVGNHSLPVTTLREIGGLDETLDSFGGWYLDLELGIRLIDAGVRFRHAPEAVSANLTHPRAPGGMFGVVPAMAYLISKHNRMDVALSPLYFQRGLGIAEYARLLRSAERWWTPAGRAGHAVPDGAARSPHQPASH